MLRRLLTLFRRSALDAELDAELSYHVEALEAEYRDRGFTVEDARTAARRDMGGIPQAKEAYRDQRGIPSLDSLLRDMRFAARSLKRTPGVAAAVVLTMAIGIGANATIFTIVNSVLLRPLPYPDSEKIMVLSQTMRSTGAPNGASAATLRRTWPPWRTSYSSSLCHPRKKGRALPSLPSFAPLWRRPAPSP